jgi:hypothetical protein
VTFGRCPTLEIFLHQKCVFFWSCSCLCWPFQICSFVMFMFVLAIPSLLVRYVHVCFGHSKFCFAMFMFVVAMFVFILAIPICLLCSCLLWPFSICLVPNTCSSLSHKFSLFFSPPYFHVSHIYKVGKNKIDYDFGISNMSKTFF